MFKRVVAGVAVAFVLALLSACGDDEVNVLIDGDDAAIESEGDNGIDDGYIVDIHADDNNDTVNAIVHDGRRNFVDVRFELVSLVFRLAGTAEYQDSDTEYQRLLNETFAEFSTHPIVSYTRLIRSRYSIGFDAVFRMSVHLERYENGWMLTDNIDFLVEETAGFRRWTEQNSARFVSYLNDFYVDTNFGAFFQEHMEYFLEHSARFYDEVYSIINFEWFSQHGINPDNLRVVLSPASSRNGYGASVFGDTPADEVVYGGIPTSVDFRGFHSWVIHEFAHAIANPIADVWYLENAEFRGWAISSMDTVRYPAYSTSLIWAYEYLTRAFTILYFVESHDEDLVDLLISERRMGFDNIEYVFAMIAEHEIIGLGYGLVGRFLGVEYEIDDVVHEIEGHHAAATWRFVNLVEGAISLDDFPHNHQSDGFPTQTGDVFVLTNRFGTMWLYIDLGSAEHLGFSENHRMFSLFSLR